MPSIIRNLVGGKSIADLKAPRSRRGGTNQIVDYWFGGITDTTGNVGDYESIQTITVGSGGQAAIDFTSIPQTYKHLQIRGLIKAASGVELHVQINGDTAANYSGHLLDANGSTTAANGGTYNANYIRMFYTTGMPTTGSVFGAIILDILDYTNTNKRKTIKTFYGADENSSGEIGLSGGAWHSTSAITQVTFNTTSSTFSQYSQLALYGLNG